MSHVTCTHTVQSHRKINTGNVSVLSKGCVDTKRTLQHHHTFHTYCIIKSCDLLPILDPYELNYSTYHRRDMVYSFIHEELGTLHAQRDPPCGCRNTHISSFLSTHDLKIVAAMLPPHCCCILLKRLSSDFVPVFCLKSKL